MKSLTFRILYCYSYFILEILDHVVDFVQYFANVSSKSLLFYNYIKLVEIFLQIIPEIFLCIDFIRTSGTF